MRKICVVTGTRAEFGLLKNAINIISSEPNLELQLVVTGAHLCPEYGLTINEILAEGLPISKKVEMLLASDSEVSITKSIGLGVIGFADAFSDLKPDLLLILGDRFEILSAAIAAMIARIPIAHHSGGESTEGLIDEAIRHSITKMSHIHFVSASEYRRRVIQLGESPTTVHLVGGLGVDNILNKDFISRKNLEEELDFKFKSENILVTFHPVTLEKHTSELQMLALLNALADFPDLGIIFTMPNSDTDGHVISKLITNFCDEFPNAKCYKSLGVERYLSVLNVIDGVVGNSSSGISEVPYFRIGTVNIGDRQKGRLKPDSVVDCLPERNAISKSIKYILSASFRKKIKTIDMLFGSGDASKKMVKILSNCNLENILKKSFHDLT